MTSGIRLSPNVAPPHKPASSAHSKKRARRVTTGLASVIAAATVLSGCSAGHFAAMSGTKDAAPKSASATPTKAPATSAPKATTASETTKVVVQAGPAGGDLSGGSVEHDLNAGSRQLDISYWTDQDPKTWYADQSTVVQVAAHIANGDKNHTIYVSRFLATMDDGTSVTTLSDDAGAFVITPPFSYNTGLIIRSSHPGATSATVIIRYELLIQTAPNASQFFRQTVIDTLHVNFASKGNN